MKDLYSEVSKTLVTKDTSDAFKKIFTDALGDENIKNYVESIVNAVNKNDN